jgi:tetratricopeptide (TPR) repeat protein
VALGTPGITNVEGLDLYRLRWTAAAMVSGEDYTLMATIAMQLGYPGEARNILQQGMQMGRLSSANGAGPAFQQARTQAAADEKLIPAFAAEAAKSPTGEKDEKLAETYYGYGRFADSEAAVRQAITKNGLRDPGQAKMLLAMNLVNQGKYQEAVDTLHDVPSGSSARMQAVRLWTIYAQHKINETAAAQPAAPAAAPATPAQ